MFGRTREQKRDFLGLKPFVFRIKDGFLIGLAMPPEAGSPCAGCVEAWLKERDVTAERCEVGDLTLRRDALAELISENDPSVLVEINRDGSTNRMESMVFPHPHCGCRKSNFQGEVRWGANTNFAFSPLFQLKCVRYGTPAGNLWMTGATGESPGSGRLFTAFGVDRDREASRFRAVEEWMKKAATLDLRGRAAVGTTLQAEDLCSGELSPLTLEEDTLNEQGLGIGATRQDAVLDGLYQMAKARTLRKYAAMMKNPMLVVGANNWIRNRVPFFLIQNYDLYLLFYPNSTPAWVVGVAALSRVRVDEPPKFVFATGSQIESTLERGLFKLLEQCRPNDWKRQEAENTEPEEPSRRTLPKLNMWWTHWIYRCPKITLKDVMQLEPYGTGLPIWRDYFRDGQEPVSILGLNSELLPKKIRYLVKVTNREPRRELNRNVNGIGTLSHFRDAFA